MTDTTEPLPVFSNKPSEIAYQLREFSGGKTKWTEIGAVWPHADDEGATLILEAIPFDRKIVMRKYVEKKS